MVGADPASLPAFANYLSFWATSTLVVLFLPFITYTHSCSKDLKDCYIKDLGEIQLGPGNPIDAFVEVLKLHRVHERENQLISYSFWSYVGMMFSAAGLFAVQYNNVGGPYFWVMLGALLLLAAFFAMNFCVVVSKHMSS